MMTFCYEEHALWTSPELPDFTNPPRLCAPEELELSIITDQLRELGYDHNVFLHGLSIADYKGALVVTYAINPTSENVPGERCWARWSYDGGKTWGNDHCFESHNPAVDSTSHGSLVVDDGKLYALVPALDFRGVCSTGVWQYQDEGNTWVCVADIPGLFPSSPVVRMEDGNFIVGGSCHTPGSKHGGPGIAVTHDGDLTNWTARRLPNSDAGFGEVGLVAQGNRVQALIRPEILLAPDRYGIAEKRGSIMSSISEDYGQSFTPATQSNIYCSKAEVCGGVLSDGRPFAIFNMSIEKPANYKPSRLRFLMAVGDAGQTTFNRLYTLLESSNPLSYPYTMEKDGVLYIAYSELLPMADHKVSPDDMPNSNNAMLMRIPVRCIV